MTEPELVSPGAARRAAGRRQLSFGWLLAAVVLAGAGLRAAVLLSPLGEIDGDEAVVGLMARHIAFLGELPVVYYGQQYIGSLEAFTAAPLFRIFDSSTPLLKLVPTAYSLGFLILSAALARKVFGDGPALITAAYLALPPSMWAVWSTKARGGYAELLFLGEALLLATLWVAQPGRQRTGARAVVWGLIAGLALWTHLLAVVYVLPCLVYLALVAPRRRGWEPATIGLGALGLLVGLGPLLLYNLGRGFPTPTIRALLQPADLPLDPWAQLLRFFRVGVPVLAGMGQPTTSATMFDLDWLNRPAGNLLLVLLMLAGLGAALGLQWPALRALVTGAPGDTRPALLLLVAACVPPVVALTRFGFFVSEPRYALPLYAVVPVVAAALWRLPHRACAAVVAGLLVFNLWSLATTDVRLWRPEDTLDSDPASRAALVAQLVSEDRHQMYTDYWIAYPVMFETRETVLGYVISGGFNRYIPHADNVQRTPNAVWVFMQGSESEAQFVQRLRALGGSARTEDVAVYRIYEDVTPIDALRPPR
jgi:hypothetical protein